MLRGVFVQVNDVLCEDHVQQLPHAVVQHRVAYHVNPAKTATSSEVAHAPSQHATATHHPTLQSSAKQKVLPVRGCLSNQGHIITCRESGVQLRMQRGAARSTNHRMQYVTSGGNT